MMRTQIQLSKEQHEWLKKTAHQQGRSLSAVLRDLVEEKLQETGGRQTREEQIRAALSVCGKYADPEGADDISVDHDRHLAEAFGK